MFITENIAQLLLADETSQELTNKPTVSHIFQIRPMVVMNILDHYSRRIQGQSRVIGALLGEYREGSLEIKNCFPVKYVEDEEQVTLDIEFYRTMYDLHHRVYPNDVVLGWYGTGSNLTDDDMLIHEAIHKNIKSNPLFLLVDTNVLNESNIYKGMAIKGFLNKPVMVREKIVGSHFKRVRLIYKATESEKIGVNLLVRKQKQELIKDRNAAAAVTTTSAAINAINEVERLEATIAKLSEVLGDINSYVQKVVSGQITGDSEIGRFLSEALDSVPKIPNEQFDKDFNDHLQDLLMLIYLSNLMRTQLTIAEKLTTSL